MDHTLNLRRLAACCSAASAAFLLVTSCGERRPTGPQAAEGVDAPELHLSNRWRLVLYENAPSGAG